MKTAEARVVAERAPKMKALVLPTSSPALMKILRAIGLDEVVARHHAQPPVELARPLHDSLELRAHDLGDPQRFVCGGAEHREQRSDHQRSRAPGASRLPPAPIGRERRRKNHLYIG